MPIPGNHLRDNLFMDPSGKYAWCKIHEHSYEKASGCTPCLAVAVNTYSDELIAAARDFPERVREAYREWPADWLEELFRIAAKR